MRAWIGDRGPGTEDRACIVLSAWFLVAGSRFLVPGSGFMVRGQVEVEAEDEVEVEGEVEAKSRAATPDSVAVPALTLSFALPGALPSEMVFN